MEMQDKKNLYLQLFWQFLIFAVSLFVFFANVLLMPVLLLANADGAHFACVIACIFVISSFFSLCVFLIYPIVGFSMYKLIKDRPLSKFQETCLKIFSKLFFPVIIEIIILIIIW